MVSEYAKQITPEQVYRVGEAVQNGYLAVEGQRDQVRDVVEAAAYTLDEGRDLYRRIESLDRVEAAAMVEDDLSAYADEAAEIAQLEDVGYEVMFAEMMADGLQSRMDDPEQFFYDDSFWAIDMAKAAEQIQIMARDVTDRYTEMERAVRRVEQWAEHPAIYLEEGQRLSDPDCEVDRLLEANRRGIRKLFEDLPDERSANTVTAHEAE